ncbi:MAG TPA: response regulator transcription factor [Mycobacteriales bacterium]|nr:response regulator transcription factor [Mycobacteriales bacterium]
MNGQSAPVLIVEDHSLLADSLATMLSAEGMTVAVADISSLEAFVADIDRRPPAVTLLDLDLGLPIDDGRSLIPWLVVARSAVLVVTGITDRPRIASAIEAGAVGYLSKSQPFDSLVQKVRDAMAGLPVLSDEERHDLLTLLDDERRRTRRRLQPFERLSHREREVLAAIADGASVDEIAAESFVARSTVRTQVHAILTKLEATNQIEAVAMARKAGWLGR